MLDFILRAERRREALLESLWWRENDYARLRLARYATGRADSWEHLPPWLPEAAPLRFLGPGPASAAAGLRIDADFSQAVSENRLEQTLHHLGERLFHDYPAQLVSGFELALSSPAMANAYGLWIGRAPLDPPGSAPRAGGLLTLRLPSGGTALALSCASCHAVADEGQTILPGAANHRLDIGLLAADQAGRDIPAARWGAGRLDVSHDEDEDPVVIPDLRPLRYQHSLHHAATLRHTDTLALAVRIETLLVTSLRQSAAPPPVVALALAVYLEDLANRLPAPSPAAEGSSLFQAQCASCHIPPSFSGAPVLAAEVGTNPAAAASSERGTGRYRVPSLRGACARRRLLHDGSVGSVEELLDPARRAAGIPGHDYGQGLSQEARTALASFVCSL